MHVFYFSYSQKNNPFCKIKFKFKRKFFKSSLSVHNENRYHSWQILIVVPRKGRHTKEKRKACSSNCSLEKGWKKAHRRFHFARFLFFLDDRSRFSLQFSIIQRPPTVMRLHPRLYLTYTKVYRQLSQDTAAGGNPAARSFHVPGARQRDVFHGWTEVLGPGYKTTSVDAWPSSIHNCEPFSFSSFPLSSPPSDAGKSCCVLAPEVSRIEARLWSWHSRSSYKFSAELKKVQERSKFPWDWGREGEATLLQHLPFSAFLFEEIWRKVIPGRGIFLFYSSSSYFLRRYDMFSITRWFFRKIRCSILRFCYGIVNDAL